MLKAQGSDTEGKRQLPVRVGQYVRRVMHTTRTTSHCKPNETGIIVPIL